MLPWKLIDDPHGYIFKWLLGYSGGLGAIAGVLIADYYYVRKKHLILADLYRAHGAYAGMNRGALIATAVGCTLAWIGLVIKPLAILYDYAWFVGAGGAALTHIALAKKPKR